MYITDVRHAWPEKKGWILDRKKGLNEYIFIHFWQAVPFTLKGEKITIRPNAVILLDKNTPYSIGRLPFDLTHDWIHIAGNEVENVFSSYKLSLNTIYYPKNYSQISEVVTKIEAEKAGNQENNAEIIENYLNILFALISRGNNIESEENYISHSLKRSIKELRNEMFLNLDKEINISDMSKKIGISESRFYSVYKQIFKITPNQDLINARINRAKILLESREEKSISNIAISCGYKNEFHFIRIFKREVGITPKKYEILMRNS